MCGLRARTLGLALLLSSGWLCLGQSLNQDANSEATETGRVRGIVINSVTREPIGHALVFSPDNRFATLTDAAGRFEFTFPTAKNQNQQSRGPSALQARKPGFRDPYKWSGPTMVNSEKENTIALAPEAIIAGRVTLASAEPSDLIEVQLYRREVQNGRAHWVMNGSTTSRSNGDFRFADLDAGTYKVFTRELLDRDPVTFDPRGQQYGYPPVYFPNMADFASANAIQLTAGKVFQADISITRQPYYQIKIPVMNAPLDRGMEVIVSSQGRRGPGFSLGYDSGQRIVTGMLPNGTYSLELASYGQNAVGGQMTITVKGGPVEGPPMALSPGPAISVNVKEEFTAEETNPSFSVGSGPRRHNSPLSLWLDPADDFGLERTVSLRPQSKPDDSSLVLENAEAGRYWVRASSSQGYVASITSGDLDLMHQPFVVSHGGAAAPIEVTLRNDFADVSGTVEGVESQTTESSERNGFHVNPSPPALVYCVPTSDSNGEFREVPVGPDGSFEMEIPPGNYRLLAFSNPQRDLEYSNPEAMRAYDANGQVVRLMGGQKEHVRLQVIAKSE